MGSPRDQFGGAQGTTYEKKEFVRAKLEDDKWMAPFRIMPAMHSLMEKNIWAMFHKQHFGYSRTNPKDKTKTFAVPFECIEEMDFKTKMISVSCPECREIEVKFKLCEDREGTERAALKEKGILNETEIQQHLAPLLKEPKGWLKAHNLDKKWYFNAVGLDGKFLNIAIPHKAKQALDGKIKELRERGIEPISDFDRGVYFRLKRTGKFNEAIFTCEVYMEEQGEVGSMKIKWAPLSDDVLDKALKNLPDLQHDVTRKINAQQIKLLIESGGDPDSVATIFDMTQNRERSPNRASNSEPVLPPASTPAVSPSQAAARPAAPQQAPAQAQQQTPPPAPKVAPQAPVESEADMRARIEARVRKETEDRIRREIEAEMAKNAPAVAEASKPGPAASTAPAAAPTSKLAFDPMDPNVSPEDFAAAFPSDGLPPR